MREQSFGDDERAVSEVISFVMVFGIIIGSVAVLSLVGFQLVEDYQENEQLQNAERGMTSLSANVDDVVRYDTIDERSSELALREGRVVTGDGGTRLNVTVGDEEVFNDTLGTFRYELDGRAIAYDGGGVFRAEESGNVSISQPPVRCDEDVAVVSLVVLEADDRTLQSDEVQEFTVRENETEVHRTLEDDVTVNVTVEDTAYETGWETVLGHENDDVGWEWVSDDTGSCDVDRATIRIVAAELEY